MPKRRKAGGTNRTVIHLSDVNVISVYAALTPPGEAKPPFGAVSQFYNELTDAWRAARARATVSEELQNDGSNPSA